MRDLFFYPVPWPCRIEPFFQTVHKLCSRFKNVHDKRKSIHGHSFLLVHFKLSSPQPLQEKKCKESCIVTVFCFLIIIVCLSLYFLEDKSVRTLSFLSTIRLLLIKCYYNRKRVQQNQWISTCLCLQIRITNLVFRFFRGNVILPCHI